MQRERYTRQMAFRPMGQAGQGALGNSHAVIVGCGALGSVASEILARAGVSRLTIIDRDFVEFSNLQRQFLFTEQDASDAVPKAFAAERRLRLVNSAITVHGVVEDLNAHNIHDLTEGANVILDATDNLETRYLLNDYAVETNTPWIYAAAVGTYGITMPFLPNEGACLRCLYPEPPSGAQPTCETEGVLGTITALIASLEAQYALRILSGNRTGMRLMITTADLWSGPIREIPQPARDPACPCCAARRFIWLQGEREPLVSLCGQNAVQIHLRRGKINLEELRQKLSRFGEARANEFALRFEVNSYQLTVFPDGRAIIKGTTDPGIAKSVYSKWIGN